MRIGIRLLLASMALFLGGSFEGDAKANFVIDGGFESSSANGNFSSSWTASSSNVYSSSYQPHNGQYEATFNLGNSLSLTQQLFISPGTYTVSFYLMYRIHTDPSAEFTAILDDQTAVDIVPSLEDPHGLFDGLYERYVGVVTTTNTNPFLKFLSNNSVDSFFLDDVDVESANPVPAPNSLALFGIGGATLLGLAFRARHRRGVMPGTV